MRYLADAALGPLLVVLLTVAGVSVGANPATAGFVFLIAVLGLAVWRGLGGALAASIAATLAFNYSFLPPLHTFRIAEPQNLVALASFLTASVVGSQLIARARRQAERAEQRQREVQMLYDLCFRLFTAGPHPGGLQEVMPHLFGLLDASGGSLRVERGDESALIVEAPVVAVGTERGRRDAVVPVLLGAAVRGQLELLQTTASSPVLESAGRLVALAVERQRLLEESAHTEALRESDSLKTALLRAVSHDLRSPLTAMGLGLARVRREAGTAPGLLVAIDSVDTERERLTRRIDNLLTLARLEAGLARPRPEPVPAAEILRGAREALHATLSGRSIEIKIAADCPELFVDAPLSVEIVVNLLENAARASEPEAALELAAKPEAGEHPRVLIEVLDRGPGLPRDVRARFAAPRARRRTGDLELAAGGLGLEIADSLARAQGGELMLLEREGGGTVARLHLPAAPVLAGGDVA